MHARPIKIVVCYPLVNAYMAACWRELSRRSGIKLFVIGFASGSKDLVAFPDSIMSGISSRMLVADQRGDAELVARIIAEQKPDILFVSGWSEKPFRKIYFDKRFTRTKKVLMMDNQYRGDLRQKVGKILLKPLIGKLDGIFVTGERSFQYARYLGFDERQIHRGVVSVDYSGLSALYRERLTSGEWPRSFLFAGRYHERKAIDVLVQGYKLYRSRVEDPWPLITAGMGPMANLLAQQPGIKDVGFQTPQQMRDLWLGAGAMVIPSRFDAWPLVIVESAAAGVPVIASQACGSTVELIHHLFNGLIVPTEDVPKLAEAMLWMHRNHDRLPLLGKRSIPFAAAYSAEAWADRVVDMSRRLVDASAGAVSE